jgi:NitT/TauT family transport system substrate-binding protein
MNLNPAEMIKAVNSGKADAVSVWQPIAKQLEKQLGDNGTVFYDERIYSDIICMSSTQNFANKNPELIVKVLKSLMRAEKFVKDNPDETRKLVAEHLNINKNILEEIWNTLYFKVTLDQSLLVSLEDQTRWARENKLIEIKETPRFLDYIYFKGLQSVCQDAVNIIQ